jgi:hypothetical protein
MQQPVEGLNENHRRRLAVSMAMVDAAIARILDLLDERTSPTMMTTWQRSLTREQARELRDGLRALQPLTAELARKYGLEKHRRNLRRTIVAELSQIWTILENCRPQKMKGMGPVAAEIEPMVDGDIHRLLEIVNNIRQAIG